MAGLNMTRLWKRCLVDVCKLEFRHINTYNLLAQVSSENQTSTQNPYMLKYAEKIAAFQRTSPEEFQRRLENANKKPDNQKKAISNVSSDNDKTGGKLKHSDKKYPSYAQHKSLDSIMKVELLQAMSSDEIETIWKQYHKERDGLFAVIPADVYEKMHLQAQEYPMFLYPLPKTQGYEFILSQFFGHSCYFTTLINYQAYKEDAPVCLTINYFSELQESKGIVLMKGEFDDKALNVQEAQCLGNQLQLYYSGDNSKKTSLLKQFNKEPHIFKHMDLIHELETSFV